MRSNRIIAVIFLAFIGVWTYLTYQLPTSTMFGEPGARFFPFVVLGLMTFLTIILFFLKEKKQDEETVVVKDEEDNVIIEIEAEEKHDTRTVIKYYGIFLGVIALVYLIGFVPGAIIGLTAMLTIIGWKLFPRAILFSSAVVLVTYALFNLLMSIPLPTGRLF